MEKENLTWRSWFDGPGTNGPIATAWEIAGWPTMYLIDHRGIVRQQVFRPEEIDKAVEKLVKEAEKDLVN